MCIRDSYLPIPDDMIVSVTESYDVISNLLDNLPYYFNDAPNPSRENGMVHALNSVYNIGQHLGGRILLFQASQGVTQLKELALKPEAAKDTHSKFSHSNPWFSKTASEMAHN